jgi:hypothetical protein
MSCQDEWREGKVRQILGGSPHGRLRRGPDFQPLKESLRRSLPRRLAETASNKTEAPQLRFLRQAESIRPMAGRCRSLDRSSSLPPGCSFPSPRTRREARILLIVRMSSDRLFLDRVGRHQSPSPLHRHEQSNTHLSKPRPKGDVSTLRRTRHFYFALT